MLVDLSYNQFPHPVFSGSVLTSPNAEMEAPRGSVASSKEQSLVTRILHHSMGTGMGEDRKHKRGKGDTGSLKTLPRGLANCPYLL